MMAKPSFLIALLLIISTVLHGSVKIVEYTPSDFIEMATEPFFYSIGKTLRYGKTIDSKSPILFKGSFFGGEIRAVYPSPDNKKAIVFTKNSLFLITLNRPPQLIVDNVYGYDAKKIGIGDFFYTAGSDVQWNQNSTSFFLVRHRKKAEIWKQVSSNDTTLMRVNVNNPKIILQVFDHFTTFEYYSIDNTICYNYPPGNGDLVWKCIYQNDGINVRSQTKNKIVLENGVILNGTVFLSDYNRGEMALVDNGFYIKSLEKGLAGFYSKFYVDKPIWTMKTSHTIKGHIVYGIMEHLSNILPGERYALLNVFYDNFTGQLLVDRQTGKYKELPNLTKVYSNINTLNNSNFQFSKDGIFRPEFVTKEKFIE